MANVPTSGRPDRSRALVGLALVVPAAVAFLVSYVLPTIWTVRTSFKRVAPLTGEGRYVGLDNYDTLSRDPGTGIGFALALGVLPALTIVTVGPLLAYAAHRAGRVGRWTVRLALVLPMVAFTPTALAVAASVNYRGSTTLANPSTAPSAIAVALWLTTFGLVCGVGVTVFLAALRRPTRAEDVALPPTGADGTALPPLAGIVGRRSPWPAVLAVGGLAVLATFALAVQSFTYPLVMTNGGPQNATVTPMLRLFQFAFQRFLYGPAAAHAVLVGVVLGALGLAAWLVISLTRMRIEFEPTDRRGGHPVAMAVGGVVVLVVLGVTLYGLWPWLSRLGNSGPDGSSTGSVVNTWLPPLVSTVVGVGLAAAAGFGIGALRPLGRFSEVLLLPFAPWLFVGAGPLSVAQFESARDADRLDSFLGLIPPSWLAVPALFLFTMLFRGLGHGRAVAALPMVALVAGATWLVQAQSLIWPFLTAADPETMPTSVAIVARHAQIGPAEIGLGGPLPVAALVVFAAGLGVLQLLYLDRVAIRVGAEEPG